MENNLALRRTLTDLDHVRLTNLIRREGADGAAASRALELDDLLDNADVVPAREVGPDVVTMYSQVQVRDTANGERSELTVCYPTDAEPTAGFVSVFSPIGQSLLGLQVGGVARWRSPAGGERSAEVLAILFQPEASHDYTM